MTRHAIEMLFVSISVSTMMLGVGFASSGCDDGGPSDGDGDADSDGDGDADIEIEPPSEPEPPASPEMPRLPEAPEEPTEPILTPCPAGWSEVPPGDSSGVATCEPWPERGPSECEIGEAHFLGEDGCFRIGSACPSGDWADDLPADAQILYVKAGAPPGGDGTIEFPIDSITIAMFASSPGTIIALSKGTFDEELTVFNNITLWGACVAETELTCSLQDDLSAAVTVLGSDVELRNFQVTGSRAGVSIAGSLANAHIEDVLVNGCRSFGLGVIDGATATGRSIVVRETTFDSEGDLGYGLDVIYGGIVNFERVSLEDNHGSGVYASIEGTSVNLTDVAVRDLPSDGQDDVGYGFVFRNGAAGGVVRGVIEGNRSTGIWVMDGGTTLSLEDTIVRDTRCSESGTFGRGLAAQDGAQVTVARSLFDRNRDMGVAVFDMDTEVVLDDVVIRDTEPDLSGDGGMGLLATLGADVALTRVRIERSWNVAVYLDFEGTSATLADVVIGDTVSDPSTDEGRGLSVLGGARTDLSRVLFDRNRSCAIYAGLEGSTLVMADVTVRDTQANVDVGSGLGMNLSDGAQVEAERIVFENNISTSIFAEGEGTSLTLTDITVRDTQSDSFAESGRGLNLQDGAEAVVVGGLFERNRDSAIYASSNGTAATLTDVTVRETTTDGLVDGGRSLNVQLGAHVEVERGLFEESSELGVFAGGEGTQLTLTDVVIRDSQGSGNGEGGRGMNVGTGAHVEMTRALLDNNREVGIWVGDEGTTLTLEDVVVSDTQRNGLGEIGSGMEVKDGASVEATRVIFEGNHGAGIYAIDDGTMLTLDDIVIRDTQLDERGNLGRGIEAQRGANVWMSRALLERNHAAGIAIFNDGTSITLRSVVIRDTLSDAYGEYGEGLAVLDGATVESTRTVFERNRNASVFAVGEGTTVIMNDVSVVGTLEKECASNTCALEGAGHGIVSRGYAHVDVTSFEIVESALCGVQVALGGTMDLHDGVVTSNVIGANVQTDEFDWDRLLDEVVFSDNERDFDSELLPVPDTGLPVDWNTE